MKSKPIIIVIILFFNLISLPVFSQIRTQGNDIWYAKEFSKEIALFNSKNYLFKNVLGTGTDVVKFEVTPLAAASSGELTTLIYKCENKQKEGLVLGFYGNYWNDAGVTYQGFAFKNFEKQEAMEFLNKIQVAITENAKYLGTDYESNNIYFTHGDMDVLIYGHPSTYIIRIFWNGFDSTWEKTAFERSKKRFEKKVNKS